MMTDNPHEITQKDLLKLLIEQTQHHATREELQALGNRLDAKIESKIDKLDAKIDARIGKIENEMGNFATRDQLKALDARIDKIDNRLWWLAGLIVALAFKSEILAFFH